MGKIRCIGSDVASSEQSTKCSSAGVLPPVLAARQHRLEQVAQCVVGAWLGLVRHVTVVPVNG